MIAVIVTADNGPGVPGTATDHVLQLFEIYLWYKKHAYSWHGMQVTLDRSLLTLHMCFKLLSLL